MSEPMIFYTEAGNMSKRQQVKLEELGITVIYVKDITKVKLVGVQPNDEMQELFFITLASIRNSTYAPAELGKRLCEKLYKDSGYYAWTKKKPNE